MVYLDTDLKDFLTEKAVKTHMGYGFVNMTDKNGELIFENSSLKEVYRRSLQSTTEFNNLVTRADGSKIEPGRKSANHQKKSSLDYQNDCHTGSRSRSKKKRSRERDNFKSSPPRKRRDHRM